jgi:multiple antibiotic resistance protein
LLRERGLIAVERLMGMLLVMLAVQMFINGVGKFIRP